MSNIIGDPHLLIYGDSYGKYGGNRLNDTIVTSEVDVHKMNSGTMGETVEFNPFEASIRDFILARLGSPVIRVELSPFQVKSAIEEAISKFSYHAPFWNRQFAAFQCSAGINQYRLPFHIADNLTYVVYKKTLLSIQQEAGTLESDIFIKYFQDNFVFNGFAVGDFYLLQQHMEMIRKILGNEGGHDIINGNILVLSPTPSWPEQVILEYRALDTNTIHPAYRNWIQNYATAIAKGILGEVRGKYSTLPSPGGGATLNGDKLVERSERDRAKLEEELRLQIEEPPSFTLF